MSAYFGKYRGKVTGNRDPLNLGRIQVSVPSVLGDLRKNWAMPCVPYAGKKVGWFSMPAVGANVWVEFEGGDPEYAIWSGCFWAPGELPVEASSPDVEVFKTDGLTLTISKQDGSKGVTLEIGSPVVTKKMSVSFMKDTIQLQCAGKTSLQLTPEKAIVRNGDKTEVKLAADEIELNSAPVAMKLFGGGKRVQIKNGPSGFTMTADQIELKQGVSGVSVRGQAVELNTPPAHVKVEASRVEVSSGTSHMGVAAAAIELSNGAGNVKVTPASVSVNNGAWEVT